MELFDRLRKKGYSLELPANLDDAEAQLEKILSPDRRDLD